jgi:hypothetical protein
LPALGEAGAGIQYILHTFLDARYELAGMTISFYRTDAVYIFSLNSYSQKHQVRVGLLQA